MEEEGKIFVGGLSWTTTEKSLHEYFTNFGGVAKVQIMRDGVTNRPRGFAFVTFDDPNAVFRVLDHKDRHILDHKQIDPKPALLQGKGGGLSANRMANRPLPPLGLGASANAYDSFLHNPVAPSSPIYTGRTKKLFIGGIAKGTDEDDVRTYFATYGLVKDVVFMSEKDTKRPRGFGFVTMDSEDSVDEIVREKFHQINGKRVEAKKAVPRPGEHEYYQQSGVSPRAQQYSGFGFPTSATAQYGTGSSGGFGQSFSQAGSQMNYAGQQQQSQNAAAGTSPAAYGFTGSAYASQAPGGPAPAFNSVSSNYPSQANSFSTSGMGRDGVFGSPPSALGSTLGSTSAGFGSSVVESGLSSSFDPFSGSGSNQVGASFSQFGSYGQEIQSAGTGFSQFGSTLGSQDIHQSSFVGGSSLLGSGSGGGPSSLPGDDSDGGFPTSALGSLTTQANSMMENSLNGQQQSQQPSQQQQRISEQPQQQHAAYYNEFGVASGNVSSSSFGGGPAAAPARGTGGSLSSNSLFGEF